MPLTTIKVPVELRERVSTAARERGVTAATLLSELLDQDERRQRLAAARDAIERQPPDESYWAEARAWDEIAGVGDDD
ncbi:ribbon-helix-helix protein [Microbacterium aurum]|uniref:Uncharacterized protein n=1 Tax=Microbacterium aurum TaxID=36805 RepID=A0A1P8U4A8_9MICO|nr:hypothetical protein [Microbacterium aurum]APZ32948.1 hypothetical protein BOH66_00490 [Microbacterium aurum]MBM7826490.1 putative DNA-binding protein [Microbacterium aurum]